MPLAVSWTPAQDAIVWQLRLPRVLAAALVGAALARQRGPFQGLFRNPMADPYVLGISSGARSAPHRPGPPRAEPAARRRSDRPLGRAGAGLVPLCAFLGAALAATLVTTLARRGNRLPITDLLLAGFATAAVLGAATTFLLVMSDRLLLRLRTAFTWLAGDRRGGWHQLLYAPLILLGLVLAMALARWLDAFLLGEEGQPPSASRWRGPRRLSWPSRPPHSPPPSPSAG